MTEVEQLREALRQKNELIGDLERRLWERMERQVCPELEGLRWQVATLEQQAQLWHGKFLEVSKKMGET